MSLIEKMCLFSPLPFLITYSDWVPRAASANTLRLRNCVPMYSAWMVTRTTHSSFNSVPKGPKNVIKLN